MPQANRLRSLAVMAVVVGVALGAGLLNTPAQAGGKNSAENVKIKATSEKGGDGARVVKLHLTIAKDWYIYANPVGNEDFASNATTVTVKGVKADAVKVTYPKAKVKEDKTIGNYNYYTGDVTIEATVRDASGPLEFDVQVNSCHLIRGVCLAPGTVKVTVP
jgi:Disulphide bond corrector protein DsbC